MTKATWTRGVLLAAGVLLNGSCLRAQDWPQWLGPNRDAKARGFQAPKSWPKELTQKWKIPVGDGVSTPALVGDKLYVFSRQDGNEILRCLDAASGKELWQDKYASGGAEGAARGFSGPRSSPIVADGKIVTLGVRGALSCYDAATGKKLWRKDAVQGSWPRFFVSSSPLVVDGRCIVQLGGSKGTLAAFDLTSGDEKWKWSGDGTAYASPELLSVGETKMLVAEMEKSIVGVSAADGKLLWQTPFAVKGRGGYNATTPMVNKQTILYSGSSRGTTAVMIEKQGDGVAAKDLWKNSDISTQFNTPVICDNLIFGISDKDALFCLKAGDGKTAWTTQLTAAGRNRGYGSVVAAGSVLFALNPSGQLIVFEPSDKSFKQLASYKVAPSDTFAYPVVSGNRIYIKDKDSLILWTIE